MQIPTIIDNVNDNTLQKALETLLINDEIKWYFYDVDNDEVVDDVEGIWPKIRCDIETKR